MPRNLRALALVMLLAVAAAGCGDDEQDPFSQSEQPQPPATGPLGGTITVRDQVAEVRSEEDVTGEKSVDVTLRNYFFDPTVLVGDPGQELEVRLANESAVAHTFTVEELGIDEELQSGEERTVTVTFPDEGSVTGVHCRFHLQQQMVAQLRVSGAVPGE